jgi:hypothetical protein
MLRSSYLATGSGAVAMTDSAATTGVIQYSEASGGVLRLPAGSSITSLTWYATEAIGGTFAPAYDQDGVAVTQTVVHTRIYEIPSALFGAAAIKAVVNAAGTVYVNLKG